MTTAKDKSRSKIFCVALTEEEHKTLTKMAKAEERSRGQIIQRLIRAASEENNAQ